MPTSDPGARVLPSVTAEAFAEMIAAPAWLHMRIVHEQKYPKRAPASYQIPFYGPAIGAIKRYYTAGNDGQVISEAISRQELKLPNVRAASNIRALEAFRASPLRGRSLVVLTRVRVSARFGAVEVRFEPDLHFLEGNDKKFMIINPRKDDTEDAIAKMTIELANHVVSQNGIHCRPGDFEYVNLLSGKTVNTKSVRGSTIEHAGRTAQMIGAIWDSI